VQASTPLEEANVAKVPQEIITADNQIYKVPAATTSTSRVATGAGEFGYLFFTCNKF